MNVKHPAQPLNSSTVAAVVVIRKWEHQQIDRKQTRTAKPRPQQAFFIQLPLPEYVCLLGKSSLISTSAVSQTVSSGRAVLESVRSGSRRRWGGVGSGGQAMEKHHCISKLKKGRQTRDFYLVLTHCSPNVLKPATLSWLSSG